MNIGSQIPKEVKIEYLGIGGLLFEMIKVFLLAVVIIIPVRVFLFQPFFVQGSSMEPNFEDGQYLIISEFGYKQTDIAFSERVRFTVGAFKTIERQDVTVFRYPKNPEQFFIKRVIGLPNETIAIERGKVIIYNTVHPDGYVLDESTYVEPGSFDQTMPRKTLGVDEYFLMGDNRMNSYDSRSIGPIKKDKIIGRVLLRAWPVALFSIY
ncbi:MAG TPA: signal peptidase I [Patescibacteria group bacterium]|nr:signal peptidase I [Patescibacteria group bacterium]